MTNMNDALRFRFRHTMLPVSDLENSIAFYTQLLGMGVQRRRKVNGRSIAYVGYGSEATHAVLELIEARDRKPSAWAGHIAIAVSDLTALCNRLTAERVRFAKELYAPDGGSSRLIAHILDPDGFQIELNELRSGIDG